MLSDETIHKCYLYIKDPFIPRYLDTGRQTAQETLKRVVEWGDEDCPHYTLPQQSEVYMLKRMCKICWQELKKQVGGIDG